MFYKVLKELLGLLKLWFYCFLMQKVMFRAKLGLNRHIQFNLNQSKGHKPRKITIFENKMSHRKLPIECRAQIYTYIDSASQSNSEKLRRN